jgi:hypothetical protein
MAKITIVAFVILSEGMYQAYCTIKLRLRRTLVRLGILRFICEIVLLSMFLPFVLLQREKTILEIF